MTPKEWYDMTIGKSYDTDNYPSYNKFQCWDYFDYFCKYMKLAGMSTYCAITGYAGDLWKLRETNGAKKYFDFVSPNNIQEGDWLFYNKHVAFYYGGREVGQNQIYPKNRVTAMTLNRNGIIGAFRYKNWTKENNTEGVAEKYDAKLAGIYTATDNVNMRTGGNTNYKILTVIKKGQPVNNYGYYHNDNGVIWLYCQALKNGKRYTGFINSKYLTK